LFPPDNENDDDDVVDSPTNQIEAPISNENTDSNNNPNNGKRYEYDGDDDVLFEWTHEDYADDFVDFIESSSSSSAAAAAAAAAAAEEGGLLN
jgi:hypothetical protein